MALLDYSEYFWGDKHHGYHVLFENFKQEEECMQELTHFFKDRVCFEEESIKYFSRSFCKHSVLGCSENAFSDVWQITKDTLSSLAGIHASFSSMLQQLLTDVMRYHEDLVRFRKKSKERDVVDAVNLMQTTTTCLQKAKETYVQRWHELERLRKDSVNAKEIAKAENKLLRSRDEYRLYVEKYATVREEFEEKMINATRGFQSHDQTYYQQLKNFLLSFARFADDAAGAASRTCRSYRDAIEQIDISKVMLKFVETKGTGREPPELIVLEEIDGGVSNSDSISNPSSSDSSTLVQYSTANLEKANKSHEQDLRVPQSSCAEPVLDDTATVASTLRCSPVASEVASSAAASSPTSYPFASSTGRQKLALWLPGRRSKHASQNNLPSNDQVQSEFSHSQSEAIGFLRRCRNWSKKSNIDQSNVAASNSINNITDDSRSTTSSNKSDEKAFISSKSTDVKLLSTDIEEEVLTIDNNAGSADAILDAQLHWSSCTDSSDDDEDELHASKLRRLNIKPASESTNASVNELRDAVERMNFSTSIKKSSTFDTDPWATSSCSPFSVSLGGKVPPLRSAFTGDDHLRRKCDSTSDIPLPFSVSMTYGGIARARPRSITPNPVSSHLIQSSSVSSAILNVGRKDESSSDNAPLQKKSIYSSLGHTEFPINALMSSGSPPSEASSRISIAMAINEYIHAWIKEPKLAGTTLRVFGSILISFPATAVPTLTDFAKDLLPLKFVLMNFSDANAVTLNKELLDIEKCNDKLHSYVLDRSLLVSSLRGKSTEGQKSPFYNFEVLRYELACSSQPPLLMSCYWKIDEKNADLRIDYRLNDLCALKNPLLNVEFSTKVDGEVSNVIADPPAHWSETSSTLSWKLTELSHHGERGGSLKARLSVRSRSNASQTYVKFQVSDALLSGLNFVLDSDDSYSLSMLRKKIISGKYFCDPEVWQ